MKRSPIRKAREAVRVYANGREVCTETAAGKREYARRTAEMAARQGGMCALCGQMMVAASFEHEAGRGMGGGHRDDRTQFPDGRWMNAATHPACNSRKGSRRFHWVRSDFIPAVYLSKEDWLRAEPVPRKEAA